MPLNPLFRAAHKNKAMNQSEKEQQTEENKIIEAAKSKAALMPKRADKPAAAERRIIETKQAESVKPKVSSMSKHTTKTPTEAHRNITSKKSNSFGSQSINFSKFVFLPEGYEKLFITVYIIALPYLTGLLFLFLFVARTNIESFSSLNLTTFMVVWAIGYEIVGSIILLIIFYGAFTFKKTRPQLQSNPNERENRDFPKVHRFS